MEEEVHLHEQIRQRLGLAALDALALELRAILHGAALLFQMIERAGEEAAGAAGRIEHGLAESRVHRFHDEADDGAGRVKFAGVARGVAHLAEHRLVEMGHRVNVVGRREVDRVHLVDHVSEQVARQHPVVRLLEHGRQHVSWVVCA